MNLLLKRPVRVQRKRKKGLRMPPGTIYVGRPSKWGNPFTRERVINWDLGDYMGDRLSIWREEAAALYRIWANNELDDTYYGDPFWPLSRCNLAFEELRGQNLACWCSIDQPCHADVLLELANPGTVAGTEIAHASKINELPE